MKFRPSSPFTFLASLPGSSRFGLNSSLSASVRPSVNFRHCSSFNAARLTTFTPDAGCCASVPSTFSSSFSSTSSFLRLSPPRLSGAPKPTWQVPANQVFHPQIPDKYHYLDNPPISVPILWWRAVRPYLEKIGKDVYGSVYRCAILGIYEPLKETWKKHNPEFRLELVAVVSFLVVQYCITYYFSQTFQYLVDIKNALYLQHARDLHDQNFFATESEVMEEKANRHAEDHVRLNLLWEDAIRDATVSRSFEKLCSHLPITNTDEIESFIPEESKFRFDMIPYGKDNQHTQTFPVPDREQPLRGFSLNFTYNNISGNWGDYIDRKDNKAGPLRHARPMFADVYIPGTK